MIGDIATGNTGFADVMFLVGFILAVVGGLAYAVPTGAAKYAPVLVAFAIGAIGLAFLVL